MGGDSILGSVSRGLGDVMTFGTNEVLGNPIGKIGDKVSNLISGKSPAGSPSAPSVGGTVSPMQALMYSGGAPLLSSIAMGSDPQTAIASYFGAKDYNTLIQGLDPQSQAALTSLNTNLTNISNNTDMRTKAVQSLVNDFPDFMKSEIPKYKDIADQATKDAANLALNKVGAKYAAGGNLSSGAMAEASARVGAEFGQANLQYGTALAGDEWTNKFNSANALLNFQQKMLGQGANQGFNAVQNMLSINAKQADTQAGLNFDQSKINQEAQNAPWNAVGNLAGTVAGKWMSPGGWFGNSTGGGTNNNGGGTANGSTNNNAVAGQMG